MLLISFIRKININLQYMHDKTIYINFHIVKYINNQILLRFVFLFESCSL